jgi:hypothetical protein
VHRRKQIPSLWKDATRPLTVFDTILWSTQLAIFVVGACALTLSRYLLRKYIMTRMHVAQTPIEHIKSTTKIFGDSLFQYYAVVVAQGSWEGLGHKNHDGKMRNHVNILHVVLGVTLIFGSCLYQGVVLTAFLMPPTSLHIASTQDFIDYIKLGEFKVTTEKVWPFYKYFYDGTVLGPEMQEMASIMTTHGVVDIGDTLTIPEVCLKKHFNFMFRLTQIAKVIISDNNIYFTEDRGHAMSIAATDCRFRLSQLMDLPPVFSHGWSLMKNAEGRAWLNV